MKIPRPVSNLIEYFERLPGVGPKTAQRLTFFLLHFPQEELEKFSEALVALKTGVKVCSVCHNIDESDPCSICEDVSRQQDLIIIVSNPLDVLAFEKVGFKGVYHVLHGVIDPLNNVGPDELFINDIATRLKKIQNGEKSTEEQMFSDDFNSENPELLEIILATNTSMEGESTAMYISKLIRESGLDEDSVRITRIARGLPVGGDIEYADDITLTRALEGRSKF